MKNIYKYLAVLVLISGALFLIFNFTGKKPTPELIGGQTDEHGCLGPAGYAWDSNIQACTRSWEIKEEGEVRAASLAVTKIGPQTGLTVIQIEALQCSGCYTVTLSQNQQIYTVEISNWQVVQE